MIHEEDALRPAEQRPNTREQESNSGGPTPDTKAPAQPVPGSPDYDAWVQRTVEEILTDNEGDPSLTLKARIMQFEGVIMRLRQGPNKKSWPTIVRLLKPKGIHANADVLRITYNRLRDDRRLKGPKRAALPQATSLPTPNAVPRPDSTGARTPAVSSRTRPNYSGRIR